MVKDIHRSNNFKKIIFGLFSVFFSENNNCEYITASKSSNVLGSKSSIRVDLHFFQQKWMYVDCTHGTDQKLGEMRLTARGLLQTGMCQISNGNSSNRSSEVSLTMRVIFKVPAFRTLNGTHRDLQICLKPNIEIYKTSCS